MSRPQPAATIAVAALSARLMAEASARDGFEVVALDLFGDADTRDVASQWMSLGEPTTLSLDDERTLAALHHLAQRGDVSGWVAGSGFEGRPGLLAEAAALLPLVGTPASAVCRVRDPAQFFGFLASQQIPYPPVRLGALARSLPADGARWLVKDPLGCGGWHVWRATPQRVAELPPHHYLQREAPGVPMSATFVGNGRTAVILGFNELTVRRFGARPYVFCGVVGPVALSGRAAWQARAAVEALTAAFDLRGLCSLDFMCDGDDIAVLEVNPRPPASMALYGEGVMAAHVQACLHDTLPAPRPAAQCVQGTEIVFARHATLIDDALARRVSHWPGAHDLPRAGTRLDTGDPLCSLSASGADAASVRAALRQAREDLLETLE
ncbi:MAG TPA: ATP-grasp domain-containing protein [Rhizobacter sp.]|nr:ATP-grasp domain-containing protein [Rhizobacter sp.]